MPVYLIRAGEDGPVKIGLAAHPNHRLKALQTAHWMKLRIVTTWPGDETVEKMMHRVAKDHHLGGEWFEAVPAILDGSVHRMAVKRIAEGRFDDGCVRPVIATPEISPAAIAALARGAIEKAGGTTAAAKLLGVSKQRVHHWRTAGIPVEQVPMIERIIGIPRHELRPDLWPAQSEGEAA